MTVYSIIVALGVVTTALFIAGFARGLRNAIAEYRSAQPEPNEVPSDTFSVTAAISVVASSIVIALAGFSPKFIYLGPFLVLGTAAACGLAFFLEKRAKP